MDWTAQLDIYCERLAPGIWAEPINAVTNLAFVIAAIAILPRLRGDRPAMILAITIGLIGLASGLFHTFATGWAALADSLSILLFVLIYLYHATIRILHRDKAIALLSVLLFLPYAIVVERTLTSLLGSLNGSIQYFPILILIFLFGAITKDSAARKGLWIGCAILSVSIFFRSIDEAICAAIPMGTHFMWHILNAIMLAWVTLVLHRSLPDDARSGVARG